MLGKFHWKNKRVLFGTCVRVRRVTVILQIGYVQLSIVLRTHSHERSELHGMNVSYFHDEKN